MSKTYEQMKEWWRELQFRGNPRYFMSEYASESLTDDRNRATEGRKFTVPEWDTESIRTFCEFHVRNFDQELLYWPDPEWKKFVTDRYHACCAWILAS